MNHPGPCEVWCDDEIVVPFDTNCAQAYPTGKIPYNKAKCVGKNRLTLYWMSTLLEWQVYTDCAHIGNGGGSSPTSAPSPPNQPSNRPSQAPTQKPAPGPPSSGCGGAAAFQQCGGKNFNMTQAMPTKFDLQADERMVFAMRPQVNPIFA
ncbi:hypothetical protein LEN26_017192 [Aphanomyces euteiches]|nr:hypothetical protein LEN26_017192 [Aphanomyces euteiches]KAH9125399.1 hypothetical protein AeMF1_003976 [Aphanomyces euteiches]KAH9187073.1 hypothetical protein AeNC1_010950 [Aphanomyces euteiches]